MHGIAVSIKNKLIILSARGMRVEAAGQTQRRIIQVVPNGRAKVKSLIHYIVWVVTIISTGGSADFQIVFIGPAIDKLCQNSTEISKN